MADEKPKRKRSVAKPKAEEVEEQTRSQVERETSNVLRTSGPMHAIYFFGVVLGALVLNLVVLILVAGN